MNPFHLFPRVKFCGTSHSTKPYHWISTPPLSFPPNLTVTVPQSLTVRESFAWPYFIWERNNRKSIVHTIFRTPIGAFIYRIPVVAFYFWLYILIETLFLNVIFVLGFSGNVFVCVRTKIEQIVYKKCLYIKLHHFFFNTTILVFFSHRFP